MGYVFAAMEMIALTARVNKLQAEMSMMTLVKSKMGDQMTAIAAQISELDSDDATVKQLNAKKANLEAIERRIDSQIKLYETKIAEDNAHIQNLQKLVAEAIPQNTPKYCGIING